MFLLLLKKLGVWFEQDRQIRDYAYATRSSDVRKIRLRSYSLETNGLLDYQKLSHYFEPGINDPSYRRDRWSLFRSERVRN